MPWGWLKKIGKVGVPIALLFVPGPFQSVAQTIYAGVLNAELAGGSGAAKLGMAMHYSTMMLPQIAAEVEKICGRKVIDEEALTEALAHLTQFFVLIEKSVGVKPS